jgi:polyferredoxin
MEEQRPMRVLRPRVMVYGVLLLTLLVGFGVAVANRSTLIVDVIRDRNSLYRELPGGLVENVYTITFVNKTEAPREYRVSASGIEGLELDFDLPLPITSDPGEVRRVPMRIQAPTDGLPPGGAEITVTVEALGSVPETVERETRLIGPTGSPGGR